MRGGCRACRCLFRGRRALRRARTGSDYLREIVHQLWTSGAEVSLVPLAVLRGRGMRRKESRLATLVYSVQEMPGEIRRLVSLLWNVRETSISVGVEVRLRDFTRQYQREGEERIVRRLTRALQIFLYREERVVWGPPLLPKRQVRQRALQDDEVRAVIQPSRARRASSPSRSCGARPSATSTRWRPTSTASTSRSSSSSSTASGRACSRASSTPGSTRSPSA